MRIKLRKEVLRVLMLSVLALVLTGCGAGSSNQADSKKQENNKNASSSELKELRIGASGQDDSAVLEGATLAVKNGYLEEELNAIGYTLKIVGFPGGGPAINESLAAGELDGAIIGDLPTFTAKSNGIDTKIIALTNQKNQYGILTASDSVKEPKDLEGKKVIVPQGTIVQYFWENYAEANNIDASKVELINVTADAPSLLQTGDADAYVAPKYVVSYLGAAGLGKDLQGDTEGIYTTMVFEVVSKVLEENNEIGTAINKALIRSQEAAIKDSESLYNALASETIPADAWKVSYAFDDTLSFLSPEITDDVLAFYSDLADWMVEHSIVSEKIDISSFVDGSYYKKALEAK